MATSPSMSASVTRRCKVHDGSTTQVGIVSYSVAGQAEAAFSPTKANYFTDTSGWSSRYYWSGESSTTTFGSSSGVVNVGAVITVYTKTIVATEVTNPPLNAYYAWYASETEASSLCNSVGGSAQYYLTYGAGTNASGEAGYRVYRYNLSISTSSSSVTVSTSINTSSYVDRTYTNPYVTDVYFSFPFTGLRLLKGTSLGGFKASISTYNPGGVSFSPSVSYTTSNSSVATYTSSGNTINAISIGSAVITASSGGHSDTINVSVFGVSSYGSDSNSIYCTFSGTMAGDTLTVTAGSRSNTITATGSSHTVWVTGLSSSTSYNVTASIGDNNNGYYLQSGTVWSGTITTDAYTPSPSVSSVTISGDTTHSLTIGESKTINYSISISNDNGSYTPSVSVTSSNSTAVSYSDLTKSRTSGSFKINALAEGSATITVKAGSKTDTITVNSTAAAPEVTVPSIDSWFITNNSIGVRIKDLNAGEIATLKVGSQTKTATSTNGGSLDLVVDDLNAGTSYDVIVSTDLNGTLWSGQKSTEATMPDIPDTIILIPEITGWWTTSSTMRVAVRNLAAGEEITLTVGSKVVKLTAEANGVGLDLTAIGLTPNTTYTVSVASNINGTLFNGSKKTSAAGSKKTGAYIGIAEYTELEYIEVTGTQYIDTGFTPNNNSGVELTFALNANNLATNSIFGSRSSTTSKAFTFSAVSSCWRFGYNNSSTATTIATDANKHTVVIDKNVCSLDGTVIDTRTNTSFTGYTTASIGRIKASSSRTYKGYGKIYSCKIYDNGTLVRNYIPCKNNEGVIGMYDLVEEKFYTNAGTGTFVAGSVIGELALGNTIGSTARKIKKMYIGAGLLPTGYTPVEYIKSTLGTNGMPYINTGFKPNQNTRITVKVNVDSTEQTIRNFFGVSVSGTYFYFGYANSSYVAGYANNSVSICARLNGSFVIDMNKNKVTIDNGDSSVNNPSYTFSTTSFSSSVSLLLFASNGSYGASSHSVFSMYYAKIYDNGTLVRDYVPCINPNGEAGMYDLVTNQFYGDADTSGYSNGFIAGNPVDNPSFARRIKKAYIGIGGVARPCFGGGELTYYGKIEDLSKARKNLAATTVGNYALFGGGQDASVYSGVVNAYDKTLTKTSASALSTGRFNLAAETVGSYALFAGGEGSSYYSTVDTYDESLTKSTATSLSTTRGMLAAARSGSYALFAGGRYGSTNRTTVDSYDKSLTRSTKTALSSGRYGLAGASIGDHALFCGGYSSVYSAVVDVYTNSATKTTGTNLSPARSNLSATTVGDYALLAGGKNSGGYISVVDAYDTSLTRTTPTSLTVAREYLAATTVGNYALFGGGKGSSYSAVVDVYDTSLTRTTQTNLTNARAYLAATTNGDYALFGGGQGSSYRADVEAYAI